MKLSRNIRTGAKWAGAISSAFLLGLWICSAQFEFIWQPTPGNVIALKDGSVWQISGWVPIGNTQANNLLTGPAMDSIWEDWHFGVPAFELIVNQPPFGITYIRIPLWAPLLLIALPTAFLLRRDWIAFSRARVGLCRKCKYDRRGLDSSAPCPECNSNAPESQ